MSRQWRHALAILALAAAPVAGCGGGDEGEAEPSSARRVGRGGVVTGGAPRTETPVAAAPTAPATERRAAPPSDDDWRTVGRPADPAPVEAAPSVEPETEVVPVERDLSAELAGAYGSPVSCFDYARIATFGESLRVNVSVTVMPSGRVNRATASGPGLNDAEVECLEARAMALNLRGPIEGAPRTISTRIEYAIETRPAPSE